MNTCKTCKHWQKKPWSNFELMPHEEHGAICMSPLIGECDEKPAFPANGLRYSYSESGSFWTGPDFGCVNHEPKEPVP